MLDRADCVRGDDAREAEALALIDREHRLFVRRRVLAPTFELRQARLGEPEPVLPAILECVREIHPNLARLLPVRPPPLRAVKAAELPVPVLSELVGDRRTELFENSRHDNSDPASVAEERADVADVEVRVPKYWYESTLTIMSKKPGPERQGVGFGMYRHHETLDARLADPSPD